MNELLPSGYTQSQGRHHVIEVVLSTEVTQSDNNVSPSINPVNKSMNAVVKPTTQSKLSKFVGKLHLATLATTTAKTLLIDIPLGQAKRVGLYTGNDIAQTDIDNALNVIQSSVSFAMGLITNPVGTIYQAHMKRKDYLLSVQKQNESAEYYRRSLLISINKGGTKL